MDKLDSRKLSTSVVEINLFFASNVTTLKWLLCHHYQIFIFQFSNYYYKQLKKNMLNSGILSLKVQQMAPKYHLFLHPSLGIKQNNFPIRHKHTHSQTKQKFEDPFANQFSESYFGELLPQPGRDEHTSNCGAFISLNLIFSPPPDLRGPGLLWKHKGWVWLGMPL